MIATLDAITIGVRKAIMVRGHNRLAATFAAVRAETTENWWHSGKENPSHFSRTLGMCLMAIRGFAFAFVEAKQAINGVEFFAAMVSSTMASINSATTEMPDLAEPFSQRFPKYNTAQFPPSAVWSRLLERTALSLGLAYTMTAAMTSPSTGSMGISTNLTLAVVNLVTGPSQDNLG
ncbi:MAG: hypothetical protein COC23_07625 [Hyphomicrobiales bacterium]|nr:MAG: hypothetical protein COC23_07625 [Hyphomicrobiales bacterium]